MKRATLGAGGVAAAALAAVGLTGLQGVSMPPQVIGALIGAVTAVAVFLLGRWSERFRSMEELYRSDLSLNIDVNCRLISVPSKTALRRERILEIRIDVKNNSRRTCCVPAVYLQTRALLTSAGESYERQTRFEDLPSAGDLSAPVNIAWIPGSIIQVAPDETESFVRWDTLDEEFIRKFPVLVVNAEVFGVSSEHVGERHFPRLRIGSLRQRWIDFMANDAGLRNTYVPYARWAGRPPHWSGLRPSSWFHLRPYQRVLVLPGGGGVDYANTRRFREVLKTMVQWTRHVTMDLRAELPGPASHRREASILPNVP